MSKINDEYAFLGVVAIFGTVGVVIYSVYALLFGYSVDDFIEAKKDKTTITCEGLITKRYIKNGNFKIVELDDKNYIQVNSALIMKKNYSLNECKITPGANEETIISK